MQQTSLQLISRNGIRSWSTRFWILAILVGLIANGFALWHGNERIPFAEDKWNGLFFWSMLCSFVIPWTTFDSLFRHPHGKVLLRLPIPSRTWVAYGVLRTLPAVAVMALLLGTQLSSFEIQEVSGFAGYPVLFPASIPSLALGVSVLFYALALSSLDGNSSWNTVLSKDSPIRMVELCSMPPFSPLRPLEYSGFSLRLSPNLWR